jgi:hypothetical protein
MPTSLEQLQQLLEKAESYIKIQFGQGVVGKLCLVAIAVCFAVAVVGRNITNDWIALFIILLLLGGFYWLFHNITNYADKHPEALMEGATLSAYKIATFAAKDQLNPPQEQPLLSNPSENKLSLTSNEVEK